jgi:hypothetical protein
MKRVAITLGVSAIITTVAVPGGRCVIRGCSPDVNTAEEAKGKWPM